jgi:uncharacterized membrane protein
LGAFIHPLGLVTMNTITAAIELDATREQVWDVLMDPRRLADWVTIHHRLGRVSDRPLVLGSTVEQTVRTYGKTFDLGWTVTEFSYPHRALWEGRGPARSHATIRYELSTSGADRTSFRYANTFALPGGTLAAVAARLAGGNLSQREANHSLRRFKHLMEIG